MVSSRLSVAGGQSLVVRGASYTRDMPRSSASASLFPASQPPSGLSSDPSSGAWISAHCDGGARGNPGPAGFGALIQDREGRVLAELSQFLGIQTNNFAEYSGLLASLDFALAHGYRRLRLFRTRS